ncbi:YqaA family protein [Methylococcus sp. EFPC2]|uniref:YqaA family protein n=1 Tax=Methylococcus sp. EFPC2 TaxID=2812648 RepID=UPI001967ADB3|nr:YqaA family protein [Methylococcus sp. EFPC2]QSA98747.1 DedA family protein [Methylococcus sp. EFPC2]
MDQFFLSTGVWGLFLSAFISSTIAPGGSEAVLAYLLLQGEQPQAWLLAVATVGNSLGAVTTWWLGAWTARRYPLEQLNDPRRRKAVETVRRHGLPILLLSWLPVVGDGFCFAAGWLKFSFPAGLAAIALGKLGRYAVIAYGLT